MLISELVFQSYLNFMNICQVLNLFEVLKFYECYQNQLLRPKTNQNRLLIFGFFGRWIGREQLPPPPRLGALLVPAQFIHLAK